MGRFSCIAVLAGIWILAFRGASFESVLTPPVVNRWDVVEFQLPEDFVFIDWRTVPQLRAALYSPLTQQDRDRRNNTGRRQEYAALTDSRINVERSDGRLIRKRERFIQRPGRILKAPHGAMIAA